jgi:hypothetical protein
MMCFSCGDIIQNSIQSPYHEFGHPDEIRLLRLQPGQHGDELRGEFFHVRLENQPDYEAISYTWTDEKGDTAKSSRVHVLSNQSEENPIPITKNCKAALRRFRLSNISRDLWIDSVCINQAHSEERSAQVKIMASIYTSAVRVLIFLGEPDSAEDAMLTQSLFRFMKKSCCNHSLMKCHNPSRGRRAMALPNDMGASEKKMCITVETMLREAKMETSKMLQLQKLFGLRWFSRIWTLQEVVMARKLQVFYGEYSIDWGYFSLKPLYVTTISSPSTSYSPDEIPPVLRLGKQLALKSTELCDLILATVSCGATDPRDKVFALRGMQRRQDCENIMPDYKQPVYQVFQKASEICIQNTQNLGILSLVQTPMSMLPSWAPNLEHPPALPTIAQFIDRYDKFLTATSQHDGLRLPIQEYASNPMICLIRIGDKTCLRVRGCRIATVLQCKRYSSDWVAWHGQLPKPNRIDQVNSGPNTWQLRKIFADWGTSDITAGLELPLRYMHGIVTKHTTDPNSLNTGTTSTAHRQDNGNADPQVLAQINGQSIQAISKPTPGRRDDWVDAHFRQGKLRAPCRAMVGQYFHFIDNLARDRCLMLTTDSVGVCPTTTEPGDVVYLLEGAKAPFVLRQKGERYTVVGEGFIHQPPSLHDHNQICDIRYCRDCSCMECVEHFRWRATWDRLRFEEILLE